MDIDKIVREVLADKVDDGVICEVVKRVKEELAKEIDYIVAVLDDKEADRYFGRGASKQFAGCELETLLIELTDREYLKEHTRK